VQRDNWLGSFAYPRRSKNERNAVITESPIVAGQAGMHSLSTTEKLSSHQ
jgi:hypothetical protein